MCGIAGIVNYGDAAAPMDAQALERMTARMAARGPDGEGTWISPDGRTALGHRRLAIIDLSPGGAQPMFDPATGSCVVFNGEIYNYRELKRELEAAGVVFRSDSDTEVVLQLYARVGEGILGRLRGMFAFAIWDARRQRLFLARDALGIKPLYYTDNGRTLRFASQVKALVAGGGIADTPSAAGMAGFFLWGHVPEPWTWVEAVKALPAGCTLTVNRDARTPTLERYFDLRAEIIAAEQSVPPTVDAVEEALAAVEDSVRQHLVADVPVGAFLSAGRDSTLVATLAARQLREPLRTITLGFDEYLGTPNDEAPVAERVAQLIGARQETHRVRREDFNAGRERILDAMDQPSIDGVNTWFVSRAAAQAGLKVALSGLGGDELFGGYSSFTQVPRLARRFGVFAWTPWLGRGLRLAAAPLVRHVVNPKWASLAEYGGSLHGAWFLRRALFMPWELPRLIPEALVREGLAALDIEANLRSRIEGIRNPELAVMALEMGGYMRHQLLRDADWAGMAHSLEIRVPLVDATLLRRWLPVAAHRFPLERHRLLEAADARVARAVSERPKSGFSIPVAQWLGASSEFSPDERGLRRWAREIARRFSPSIGGLRIAALITNAYGGTGGIAKFNRDLLSALAAMPEVAQVMATPRLVQYEPEPIPAKVLFDRAAARGKSAYALRLLRQVLARGKTDLILCGHINLLPLAWLASRLTGCPFALVVHGIEAWQPHRSSFVRALLPRTHLIVAVSRYTVQRMRAWLGVAESRFHILPNCVDLETFAPRPRNAALVQRFGLAGRRVLLTVGRLVSQEGYKGFDEVIEVLPELAREMPDLVYVIVGDGDDRPRLQTKARSLGVAERVVFTGFVSEAEKIDLYNLADVYVMPSRGEGFGIVYLEAMASGVPTIGSVLDGSRDALRYGQLGLLVDPRDRQQIVHAIRDAIVAPHGRPAGLEYFGVEAHRQRVAHLVHYLVGRAA
jgi:asparagine synthase (glutamine-hydrolysing)